MHRHVFSVFILLFFLSFLSGCLNHESTAGALQDSLGDIDSPKVLDIGSPKTPFGTIPPTISGGTQPTDKIGALETMPLSDQMSLNMRGPQLNNNFDGIVLKAKEDLARRQGIAPDEVRLVALIGQEFTASEFNCQTEKERIARDAPLETVEGYSILLRVMERSYEYLAKDDAVFFCRTLLGVNQ